MVKKARGLTTFRTKEIIGLEELAWLLVGLLFGWLGAKLGSFIFVAIPVAIFVVWIGAYLHRKTLI